MATIKRIGFGQVEPNHLSAQRTAQIYAQLPAHIQNAEKSDAETIEILENGNLTIVNSLDGSKVVVNNCTTGEVITFNADTKTIYSNKRDSTIQNYFNYNFLKVVNKSDEFNSEEDCAKNVYTTNLKCIISFSYSPIAKIGVI